MRKRHGGFSTSLVVWKDLGPYLSASPRTKAQTPMTNRFNTADLAQIESRARQMQAEAIASYIRGAGRGLRRLISGRRHAVLG